MNPQTSELYQLCKNRSDVSFEGVEDLVQNGADLENVIHEEQPSTCLCMASQSGNLTMVRHLIELGSNMLGNAAREFENNDKETPLCAAVSNDQLEVAQELLKHDRRALYIRDHPLGYAPIHLSAEKGNIEMTKELLKYGKDQLLLHTLNTLRTPLYGAVAYSRYNVVKLVLEYDQSALVLRDNVGRTPLHVAIQFNDLKMVQMLLEYSLDPLRMSDYDGNTPLHTACSRNLLDIVQELLIHDRDALEYVTVDGDTPLHLASKRGHLDIVDEILNTPGHTNMLFWKNTSDETPLQSALSKHHKMVASLLRQRMQKEIVSALLFGSCKNSKTSAIFQAYFMHWCFECQLLPLIAQYTV